MNYVDDLVAAVRDELAPEDRPSSRSDELFRLYALLVLTRGTDTTLEDVHNAWSVWISESDPTHPSLVPFGDLTAEVQAQDKPFQVAIHQVAQRLSQW